MRQHLSHLVGRQHDGQHMTLCRSHEIKHGPRALKRHFVEKANATAIHNERTARYLSRRDEVEEERAQLGFRERLNLNLRQREKKELLPRRYRRLPPRNRTAPCREPSQQQLPRSGLVQRVLDCVRSLRGGAYTAAPRSLSHMLAARTILRKLLSEKYLRAF